MSGAGQASVPGAGKASPQVSGAGAASGSTDAPSAVGSNAPTNALRTGFTAADVAANRRKQAAPEHERSLAQATSGFPVVTPRNGKPADSDDQAEKSDEPATVDEAAEAVTPAPEPVDTPEPAEAEAESTDPEPAAAEEKAEPAADPEPEAVEKTEPEPEETVAEETAAEDKTSVVAAVEEEKTSLLLPAARPRPSDDDKTSVVSVPPRRRIVTAAEPATQVVGDLGSDPGFSRPNRPAWTPMQMRPVVRRTTGITILGTTLTRRQAAIGLGIVLTFLLLVGIIVVQAFGNDDPDDKDPTKAQVNPTTQVQPGGGKSEGPKQSSGTSPSPAKSSPAPSSASPEIPAGWRMYQGDGWRFPVPNSVSYRGGSTGTTLDWGNGRQIRVDIVPGKNDPVDYLKSDRNTGYDKTGPILRDFNGIQAADLEYYRNASGGTTQRVVRRVFVVKSTTYVLTWYTVADDWEAAKGDLQNIYAGFQAK